MTPVSGSTAAKKYLPVKVHPLFKDSFETLGSNLDSLLSGNSFKAFRFTPFTQKTAHAGTFDLYRYRRFFYWKMI
jgi:hypothetical protein